jgi:hypothetical protein
VEAAGISARRRATGEAAAATGSKSLSRMQQRPGFRIFVFPGRKPMEWPARLFHPTVR